MLEPVISKIDPLRNLPSGLSKSIRLPFDRTGEKIKTVLAILLVASSRLTVETKICLHEAQRPML
jgi:hypothetical protein